MRAGYWILGSALAGAAIWSMRGKPRPRTLRLHLPEGAAPSDSAIGSVQFIGTATTLIRHGGLTILTDPNFLHRGERIHVGYGIHATRLTDPAIDFDRLPAIDFVLLSHLHEDHFDKLVERSLAADTPILTTRSAARTLRRRGFTRTYPLRTWDRVVVRKGADSLLVTSLPGRHGPLVASAFMPDVMGSMLEFRNERHGGEYRIYVSGDTLVFSDLEEIPLRYPGIDLALLHLGGARVMGILVTMNAAQGIEALRIVQPEKVIPVHYNDYDLFREPLDVFRRAVEQAGLAHKVRYLNHGETYEYVSRGARVPVERLLGK